MPKVETRKKPTALPPAATILTLATLPTIGAPIAGGRYYGVSIRGHRPVGLILLPGDFKAQWQQCMDWAKKQGGELILRIDGLVLLQNAKDEFKLEAYWTSEPYAGDESYAWCQYFNYGYQDNYRKDAKLRARAVRSVPIQ